MALFDEALFGALAPLLLEGVCFELALNLVEAEDFFVLLALLIVVLIRSKRQAAIHIK